MGMMDNTTVIGFAGFSKSDIMLYFARILHLLGENTAIIDRSTECEIVYSVPYDPGCGNILEYRGIDIYLGLSNFPVGQLPLNYYSSVLIDLGVNPDAYKDLDYLKILFIVTDLNRHHTIPLSAWLGNLPVKPTAVRIIRDTLYGKIRPDYIDSLLKIQQVANIIASYEFPFDEREYYTRLLTQYDDIFKFNKIPKEFKTMLIDCVTEIFNKQRRDAVKALKKAQLGG